LSGLASLKTAVAKYGRSGEVCAVSSNITMTA
jgi:hypothetical protein